MTKKTKAKKVSTVSLVNNEAFRDRRAQDNFHNSLKPGGLREGKYYELEAKVQEAVSSAVKDINSFYTYFDVVRGLVKGMTLSGVRAAYRRMCEIKKRYPTNPVLANKLDEASGYL